MIKRSYNILMLKKRELSESRHTVTLPDERYRAVAHTERFLRDLCDPTRTPRVPQNIRTQARSLLRHYPTDWDMDRAAQACPEVFIKHLDPLYKMVKQHDMQQRLAEDVEEDLRAAHQRGDI